MTLKKLVTLTPLGSANLHIRMVRVHKPWGPQGFTLRGFTASTISYKGLQAEVTLGTAAGLILFGQGLF